MQNNTQLKFRKLFVDKISFGLNDQDLREYFGRFGVITECKIQTDPRTKRQLGFGFVTFEQAASVDAVQESRPHYIKGCEVTTKRAIPKELLKELDTSLTVSRVFVGGIKHEILESDIRAYFSSFGRVRKVDVVVDRVTSTKRGIAFVEFDDYDPVDKIVLQGKHKIRGTEVRVEKAKSRMEMEYSLLRKHPPLRLRSPYLRHTIPNEGTRTEVSSYWERLCDVLDSDYFFYILSFLSIILTVVFIYRSFGSFFYAISNSFYHVIFGTDELESSSSDF